METEAGDNKSFIRCIELLVIEYTGRQVDKTSSTFLIVNRIVERQTGWYLEESY